MPKPSCNFSFREMWVSADHPEIIKAGIEQYPPCGLPDWTIPRLSLLCYQVLQPIRDKFNKPLHLLSVYRNDILNTAVGGSKTSDHMQAIAADFYIKGVEMKDVFMWIQKTLCFRQLIFYPANGFIHVSMNTPTVRPYKTQSWVKGQE